MSDTLTENQVEKERIKCLKKYDILDTPPDGSFDSITKLAAILLQVPIAIVTMVDTDRIWFKSRYGIDVQQISRDPGLCASAILSDEFYEVDNALTDPRTLSNPLVASEFGLRFYAAVPLKVKDGYNLGTLCIIDKQPRKLSESEKNTLEYLANILIDQLELRLAARTAIYQQNQVLSIAAHDLKNPLTTITAWAEMAKSEKNNPEAVEKMCDRIKDAGFKMNHLINDVLESARKEASKVQLIFKSLNFAKLVQAVVSSNEILARKKDIKLHLQILGEPFIMGDENRISEIADNLINNSIKYSHFEKNIFIIVDKENENAILSIKDEGQGFTEEDKKNIFQRFVRLSANPTGGETSTGIGLSIVKSLVDAHKGTIQFESDGKDKGATFTITIPVA